MPKSKTPRPPRSARPAKPPGLPKPPKAAKALKPPKPAKPAPPAEARALTRRSLPGEVKAALQAAEDKKGEAILALDLRQTASFTDYFVILNGRSSRQNQALAEAIEAAVRETGIRPLGVEGTAHAEWILIDYGSFVVHVFSPAARDYYALEKLWGDAPRLAL